MTRVLADYEYLAVASNDLALVAHFLDRRTYLHFNFLSVMCFSFIYHAQPQAVVFVLAVCRMAHKMRTPGSQAVQIRALT